MAFQTVKVDYAAEGDITRQFPEQGLPVLAAGRVYGNLLDALGTEFSGCRCHFFGAGQQNGLISGCQFGRQFTGFAIAVAKDDPQARDLLDQGGTLRQDYALVQ